MMRNAWHISGGQGAAANSSCIRVLVTHTDGAQEVSEEPSTSVGNTMRIPTELMHGPVMCMA
eukprot:6311-Eustigmatos_ZCMA.PRE.1